MIVAFIFNLLTLPLTVHFVALGGAVPNRVRTLGTMTTGVVEIFAPPPTTLAFL
jgi:hypothetical protein